jgi:hypothetical protein
MTDSEIEIDSCEFVNGFGSSGGAIALESKFKIVNHLYSILESSLKIIDSVMKNNIVDKKGGAIFGLYSK